MEPAAPSDSSETIRYLQAQLQGAIQTLYSNSLERKAMVTSMARAGKLLDRCRRVAEDIQDEELIADINAALVGPMAYGEAFLDRLQKLEIVATEAVETLKWMDVIGKGPLRGQLSRGDRELWDVHGEALRGALRDVGRSVQAPSRPDTGSPPEPPEPSEGDA
jgi:hypothetical protein